MKKEQIKKEKSYAFGKDIYLLGVDESGERYWLEAPSWDCDWYWGFGYVETYTNNKNPGRSKDIASHTHIDGFMGQHEYYDTEKGRFVKGEYIHNIYDSPRFAAVTFNESEGWELSELFKQFYLLRKMADFCHKDRPGCHVTDSPVNHGNMKHWYKEINEDMIPRITAKILGILSPE